MSLKVSTVHKHGRVTFRSGYFYKFAYQGYRNDPTPTVIFLNAIYGIHPTTGHQWRFIQAINLSYIPRKDRQRFVNDWLSYLGKTRNVGLTWQIVKQKYPYIAFGIRRYFFKPEYYIGRLEEIPLENVQKEVVGTWLKDFSHEIKKKILNVFNRVTGRKKRK